MGLIPNATITIGYDVPWRKVHDLLIEAAPATDGMIKEHRPFVLQTSLDDFYVSSQVDACTNQPLNMPRLYSRLRQNIQDRFREAGVEIMCCPIPCMPPSRPP